MFVFDVLLDLLCVLCLYGNVLSREALLTGSEDIGQQKQFDGKMFFFHDLCFCYLFIVF